MARPQVSCLCLLLGALSTCFLVPPAAQSRGLRGIPGASGSSEPSKLIGAAQVAGCTSLLSIAVLLRSVGRRASQDELKKQVGYKAVDDYVKSGTVIGLGTGSTAAFAVDRVGEKLKSGELKDIIAIPTSIRTKEQAESLGIPLATLDTHSDLDVAIDGADEVDPALNLVKGGGGALFREKIVEMCAKKITFNPRARLLEQAPLPELEELRGSKLVQQSAEVSASAPLLARLPFRSALRSETIVRVTLPQSNAILRVGFSPSPHFAWMESVGFSGPNVTVTKVPESSKVYGAQYLCQSSCEEDSGCLAWSFVHQSATCHHKAAVEEVTVAQQSVSGVKQSLPPLSCAVFYEAVESKRDMEAICGDIKAPLRLLAGEKSLELRIFADATFLEVFFQNGRLAMTVPYAPPISSELMISSTVETSAEVSAYAMKSIWVNEEYVRKQSRVYPRSVDLWS